MQANCAIEICTLVSVLLASEHSPRFFVSIPFSTTRYCAHSHCVEEPRSTLAPTLFAHSHLASFTRWSDRLTSTPIFSLFSSRTESSVKRGSYVLRQSALDSGSRSPTPPFLGHSFSNLNSVRRHSVGRPEMAVGSAHAAGSHIRRGTKGDWQAVCSRRHSESSSIPWGSNHQRNTRVSMYPESSWCRC